MPDFNQKCPHCQVDIDCETLWRNTDHQSEFEVVCGDCDGILRIIVHQVAEFATDFCRCASCKVPIDGTRDYCGDCQRKLTGMNRDVPRL